MNLVDSIRCELFLDLENRGPKDGARAIRGSIPERGVVEIFSFKDTGKKGVFIGGNVPGSVSDKTFINRVKIPKMLRPPFSLD